MKLASYGVAFKKIIHRQDAKAAKSPFVSRIGRADTEKRVRHVPASRMEFRRRGSGLALRVIRAGPPEFAGFQPAGATRPVKRFWAEVMEGRDRCSAFLGVLGVLAVSLFSISLNATWY